MPIFRFHFGFIFVFPFPYYEAICNSFLLLFWDGIFVFGAFTSPFDRTSPTLDDGMNASSDDTIVSSRKSSSFGRISILFDGTTLILMLFTKIASHAATLNIYRVLQICVCVCLSVFFGRKAIVSVRPGNGSAILHICGLYLHEKRVHRLHNARIHTHT